MAADETLVCGPGSHAITGKNVVMVIKDLTMVCNPGSYVQKGGLTLLRPGTGKVPNPYRPVYNRHKPGR